MKIRVNNIILLIFVVAPFLGIFKMLIGVGYAPILVDIVAFLLLLFFIFQRGFPLNVYVLMLLLFICLGMLLTFVPYDADLFFKFMGFRSSVFYMIFALLPFYQKIDDDYVNMFVKVNMVTGIVVFIYAIRQYIYPLGFELTYSMQEGVGSHFYGDTYEREENRFRIFGSMITSTHLASYALFIFFLSFLNFERKFVRKSLFISGLCLSLIVLFITYSRTSLIGMVAGLVFYMIIFWKNSKGLEVVYGGLYLIFIGVVAGVVVLLLWQNIPMLADRFSTLSNIEEISSFQSRLIIWGIRIEQIGANWLGYGTGIAGFHGGELTIMPVDSQFLKMFIEMGWVGGVLFIIILMVPFFVRNRLPRKTVYSAFVNGGGAFLFAIIVVMGASQILEGFPIAMYFWYMSGLIVVLKKQNMNKRVFESVVSVKSSRTI